MRRQTSALNIKTGSWYMVFDPFANKEPPPIRIVKFIGAPSINNINNWSGGYMDSNGDEWYYRAAGGGGSDYKLHYGSCDGKYYRYAFLQDMDEEDIGTWWPYIIKFGDNK